MREQSLPHRPCAHGSGLGPCPLLPQDIVPRAFTCDYRLVQNWLRRIGGSFRDHTCLQGDGVSKPVALYMPIGVQMVLQPSETAAAQHVMLPQGSGLWKVVDPNERLLWGGVFGEREAPAEDAGGAVPYRCAAHHLAVGSPPLVIIYVCDENPPCSAAPQGRFRGAFRPHEQSAPAGHPGGRGGVRPAGDGVELPQPVQLREVSPA